MGFFRIFFAAIVLFDHLGIYTNGLVAVKSFFIISGFYMSLILNEKYSGKKNSYFLFITNRILRLYPIYWLMLIIASIIYLPHLPQMLHLNPAIYPHVFKQSSYNSALFACKQIVLFCDAGYFLNHNPGIYSLIAPMWSVGLEMFFYFLAPFFVRSPKGIFLVLVLSLLLKFAWYQSTFNENLLFFTLGSVSYQLYRKIRNFTFQTKFSTKMLILLFVVAILLPYILIISTSLHNDLFENIYGAVYYIAFALVIPVVFCLTQKSKIDSILGSFSYPVYVSHLIILHLLERLETFNTTLYIVTAIIAVAATSYILITFVENPIDRFRAWRVKVAQKKTTVPRWYANRYNKKWLVDFLLGSFSSR